MPQDLHPTVDRTLLRLVEEVLRSEQYEVLALASAEGAPPMVLAENTYFMVAATAVATVQDLPLAEPYLVSRLSEVTANAGPKRWDAYALVLTQQEAIGSDSDTSRLFELAYDTSRARRIVHVGVKPDLESVRRAVIPFIPPPSFVAEDLLNDPLDQVQNELVGRGIGPDIVTRAVEVYRAGGKLSDAL